MFDPKELPMKDDQFPKAKEIYYDIDMLEKKETTMKERKNSEGKRERGVPLAEALVGVPLPLSLGMVATDMSQDDNVGAIMAKRPAIPYSAKAPVPGSLPRLGSRRFAQLAMGCSNPSLYRWTMRRSRS